MATGLDFKIYKDKEFIAATKYAEDAAAVAAITANAVVKYGGRIVWREDREGFSAGESYDQAAGIMWNRIREHRREREEKYARSRAAYARERSTATA